MHQTFTDDISQRNEINEIISKLYNSHMLTIKKDPDFSTIEISHETASPWVVFIVNHILSFYHDPCYSPLHLAKALNMSERNFQRKLKQEFNLTFKEILVNIRLEMAKKMLSNGDKISDVAVACGFNEPSYFARIFKSKYQITPSEYRENQRDILDEIKPLDK